MRTLTTILFLAVFTLNAGRVAVVSKTRATKLKGKETAQDLRFNPVLDSLGRWVVSEEEIEQLTDSDYLYLKALPLIEFAKPRDTIKAW